MGARASSSWRRPSGASAVVAAATDHGSEVLAHLGAMTGLPVAANCVVGCSLLGPGRWQLVRQRWAGSVLEDADPGGVVRAADGRDRCGSAGRARRRRGCDAAVRRPTVRELARRRWTTPTCRCARPSRPSRAPACRWPPPEWSSAAGAASAGRTGSRALEELAGLLGGVVGVSRVVTSQGWRPHRQQVGQTGTKISPELYLACGISGAIQHMAGCLSARHIVVVNTDADAPIIAHAEYAVIGDLNEVVPGAGGGHQGAG